MNCMYALPSYAKLPYTYVSSLLPDVGDYWRSDVVIVGIGVSALGTVIALVQAYTLIATISFIATCILSFAFYYVEAYVALSKIEEQAENLRIQTAALKETITALRETHLALTAETRSLTETNTQLQTGVERMQEENIQLQRNVTQMDEKNITLTAEITRFKEANDLLSGNLEKFNAALASIDGIKRQIQDAQRGLAAIREDTQKESERYTQLNQESGRLQGAIATETKHLQEIASRFEVYASSLQASSADNCELVQQLRDIVLNARTYAAVQYPQRILVS